MIFVNGKRVPYNISETYWNVHGKQMIRADQFTLENGNCKANSLVTQNLNAIPVVDLILLNAKEVKNPVKLVIQKSEVAGDIKGLVGNLPSLIFLLNQTAVPINGPPTVIQSSIDFREAVNIRNLRAFKLNDLRAEELIHTKTSDFSFNEKIIEELETNQINIGQSCELEKINDVNLLDLPKSAVRIDAPVELENLRVESFDAVSLKNGFFENLKLNDFLAALGKEFSGRDSSTSRRVKVTGSCNFLSNIFTKSLNGPLNIVNNLFNFLVLKNDEGVVVGGVKTFKDLTVLQSFKTSRINNLDLDRLLHKSLSADKKQTLDGEVFVESLQAKHLQAKLINNISNNEFIDKTSFDLHLNCNLDVKKLNVRNVDVSSSKFDVRKMIEYVEFPPRTEWKNIRADEGVVTDFTDATYLDHLVKYAVLKNGPPKQVFGQVTLDASNIYVKTLFKDDYTLISKSQPINIQNLHFDSVKNESSSAQVVMGIKQFIEPFYMKNARVHYSAIFEAQMIDDVKIQELNNSIHRANNLITGEKQFYNLHVENLYVNGLLSGVEVKNYVALYPEFLKFTIPSMNIGYLHVNDFNTADLAGVNYSQFLRDRLMCESNVEQLVAGPIAFKSVDVFNDTILAYLNDVNVNDMATTRSDHPQVIHGKVVAEQGVHVVGPCNVDKLNERHLDEVFETSVNQTVNYRSDYLKTKDLVLKKGLIVKHSIGRNISLESLSHSTPKIQDLMSTMSGVRSHIGELAGSNVATTGRKLYIDFDRDIQIVQNLQSAQAAGDDQTGRQVVEPINHNVIQVQVKPREIDDKANLPFAKVHVMSTKAECENQSRSLKISWNLTNSDQRNELELCLLNPVDAVHFVETKSNEVIVILVIGSGKLRPSEIMIFRLERDNEASLIQKIENLNNTTKIALVDTSQNNFMIISSFNDKISFVKSLIFCPNQTQFVDTQQKIPSEKFDILLPIKVNHISFLLLAKSEHKDLLIYRLNEDTREFKFLRRITFENGIKEIVVMKSQHESESFIVSLLNGQFCNFVWRGIESWKSNQCGFFKRISSITPYQHLERNHIYISNKENDATALTLFRQGDRIL